MSEFHSQPEPTEVEADRTPDPELSTRAAEPNRQTKRVGLGLAGVLMGAAAVMAPIALLGAGADATTTDQPTAEVSPTQDEIDRDVADRGADDAEFEAYIECVDEAYEGVWPEEGADLDEADHEDWAAMVDWDAIDAVLAECDELVPAEIEELEAAFEAYDQCLIDNGLDVEVWDEEYEGDDDYFEEDFAGMVVIEDIDEATFAEFGPEDGSVTITKTDDGIELTTDGDVIVLTEDDLFPEMDHPAFDACDGLLPDDMFDDFGWDEDDEMEEAIEE